MWKIKWIQKLRLDFFIKEKKHDQDTMKLAESIIEKKN